MKRDFFVPRASNRAVDCYKNLTTDKCQKIHTQSRLLAEYNCIIEYFAAASLESPVYMPLIAIYIRDHVKIEILKNLIKKRINLS